MKKNYYVDTCCLMEGEDTIKILRNGEENNIKISLTTINELDNLSKKSEKRWKAIRVIKSIWENKEIIDFIGNKEELFNDDDYILKDAKDDISDKENSIIITNDLVFKLKAYINGIKAQEFKSANPFDNEMPYTGIINYAKGEELINNCFFWKEGKIHQYTNSEEKNISYNNTTWNVNPRDDYQRAALEILNNPKIPIKTIQSKAGTGKSFLSLASGLRQVFQEKKFKKLIIIKTPCNIGDELGFLPGTIEQKMDLHWKPLYKLLIKLQEIRPFNKGWIEPEAIWPQLNPKYIEFVPSNYLRGDNIDNAFVIISEGQNIPRSDMRSILSRMGENTNVVIEGDVKQIDNHLCNEFNNGLNWIIKLMKGDHQYAHITMNCKRTRGKICDLVHKYKL